MNVGVLVNTESEGMRMFTNDFNPDQPGRRHRTLLPILMFYMSSDSAIHGSCSAWGSLGGQLCCHVYVCVYAPLWDTHTASLRVKMPRETRATSVGLGRRHLLGLRLHLATLWQWEGRIPSQHPTHSDQVLLDIPHEEGLRFNIKLI